MEDVSDRIQKLQDIDLKDVKQGREKGIEQNVKEKIVIELLECLGYDKVKDMDFEHFVKNKRADIALIVDGKPKVIIECKSLEKNLDESIDQALEYAYGKQVGWTVLTNGMEFRLYKSFIENVINPKDRLLLTVNLKTLSKQFGELKRWISIDSLRGNLIDKISEHKEKIIKETVTAKTLIKNLSEAKELLARDCRPIIKSKFENDKNFHELVLRWAESSEIEINDSSGWLDKLSKEIAYSFINKLYFYRIAEDRGIVKQKLSFDKLKDLEKSLDLKDIIKAGFDEILRIDYEAIFEDNFFGQIDFSENVLKNIVHHLSQYNFGSIDSDIIGKVYEFHISREERRELGQFYTPEWIIDFILDKMPIKISDKILDPACGSGGFLIRCYDKLKDLYLKDRFSQEASHKIILKENIFGYDINPFAVQLTAINLSLKDLEHKTNTLNVLCRDSLYSGLLQYSGHKTITLDKSTVNNGSIPSKFDIIVGNPPYFVIKIEDAKERYKNENYNDVLEGKTNIAGLFLKRYIDLLKNEGYLGFVVPKALTYIEPWKPIRKYILQNCEILDIFDLKEGFEEVLLEQIILVLRKTKSIQNKKVNVFYKKRLGKTFRTALHTVPYNLFNENIFPIYLDKMNLSIMEKSKKNSTLLKNVTDITRGLYIQKYKDIIKKNKSSTKYFEVVVGKDVGRFTIRNSGFIDASDKRLEEFKTKTERITKEKLMCQRIVAQTKNHIKIIATYDSGKILSADTVINIIPKIKNINVKYLLGIVNSKFASYFLYNMIYNRAVRSMNLEYIRDLPIKIVDDKTQQKIANMVDKALKSKNEDIENAINKEVYKIYGLLSDEIKAIEEQV